MEVVELTWLDATSLDEAVDVSLLEAYHPAELVGNELSFVDKSVERLKRHSETGRRFAGVQPYSCVGLTRAALTRAALTRAALTRVGLTRAALTRAALTRVLADTFTLHQRVDAPEVGSKDLTSTSVIDEPRRVSRRETT